MLLIGRCSWVRPVTVLPTARWKKEQERARVPSAHATPAAPIAPAPVVAEDESEEEVDLEPVAGSPVKRAAVVVPPGPVLGVQKRCVPVNGTAWVQLQMCCRHSRLSRGLSPHRFHRNRNPPLLPCGPDMPALADARAQKPSLSP